MQHIILIGFKNVGKSSVGKSLAMALNRPFRDSDAALEDLYEEQHATRLSCNEIMRAEGEEFFRALEHEALKKILAETSQTIIATGGGAPIQKKNADLLRPHKIVYLTAPKDVVYERIIINGLPAFFPQDVDPYIFFENIWQERRPHYERLATVTIENNLSIDDIVSKLTKIFNVESIIK